jgi:hypothetical protein
VAEALGWEWTGYATRMSTNTLESGTSWARRSSATLSAKQVSRSRCQRTRRISSSCPATPSKPYRNPPPTSSKSAVCETRISESSWTVFTSASVVTLRRKCCCCARVNDAWAGRRWSGVLYLHCDDSGQMVCAGYQDVAAQESCVQSACHLQQAVSMLGRRELHHTCRYADCQLACVTSTCTLRTTVSMVNWVEA